MELTDDRWIFVGFKLDGSLSGLGATPVYIGLRENKPTTNRLFTVFRVQGTTGRVVEYVR